MSEKLVIEGNLRFFLEYDASGFTIDGKHLSEIVGEGLKPIHGQSTDYCTDMNFGQVRITIERLNNEGSS